MDNVSDDFDIFSPFDLMAEAAHTKKVIQYINVINKNK